MSSPNAALKLAMFNSRQTQDAVAEKADIHPTRLSKIVRGHVAPTDEEKKSLARVLRASVEGLFGVPERLRA